ncbi:unnamed protein product [Linum trigynum]|uniref:Secreted protein n=1 Tax=Linum trigynum TaxID=586398 RepID=A0AAV2FQ25_9ROSI
MMIRKSAAIALLLVLHLLAADIPSSSALRPYGCWVTSLQAHYGREQNGGRKAGNGGDTEFQGKNYAAFRSLRTILPKRAPPPPIVNKKKSYNAFSTPSS